MTEQEWLECGEPKLMLEFLRGKASDRTLRLFACACCYRIWDLMTCEKCRRAVEVAERFADGQALREECDSVGEEAVIVADTSRIFAEVACCCAASWAITTGPTKQDDVNWSLSSVVAQTAYHAAIVRGDDEQEKSAQSTLLRDILGNPFRPVTREPAWLTPTVVALASGIYDERAFDRLPILADALQDAGCDTDDILNHCRGPGPHVRGCWVVDLVLGKS